MLVQAHHMLRTLVWRKGKEFHDLDDGYEANCCVHDDECAPALDSDSDDSETEDPSDARARRYASQYTKPHRVFRDERRLNCSLYFGTINWADYIDIHPDSLSITLRGHALRGYLDGLAKRHYYCAFADILDRDASAKSTERRLRSASGARAIQTKRIETMRKLAYRLAYDDFKCRYQPPLGPLLQISPPLISPSALATQLSSTSLSQSGHAYLRDNPANVRSTREGENSLPVSAALRLEPPLPRSPIFIVNSKQLKLAERLFGKREGKVGWDSLVNVRTAGSDIGAS